MEVMALAIVMGIVMSNLVTIVADVDTQPWQRDSIWTSFCKNALNMEP